MIVIMQVMGNIAVQLQADLAIQDPENEGIHVNVLGREVEIIERRVNIDRSQSRFLLACYMLFDH